MRASNPVPTPVPTIETEFMITPPELAVTQGKPGIARGDMLHRE